MAILLIVYGALMGLGGLIGYRATKSRASFVVGGFSGVLLILCGVLVQIGMTVPAYVGFAWTILLCLLFGMRYSKTKKIRPAGIMLALSGIVLVAMLYSLYF